MFLYKSVPLSVLNLLPKVLKKPHLISPRKLQKNEVECQSFFVALLKFKFWNYFCKNYFYRIPDTPKYPKQVKNKKKYFLLARNEFSKSKFHAKIDPCEIKF